MEAKLSDGRIDGPLGKREKWIAYFISRQRVGAKILAPKKQAETWKVETENHGSSQVTRWACIWRTVSLDTEARRLLHRRFGSPPIVVLPLKPDSEVIARSGLPNHD